MGAFFTESTIWVLVSGVTSQREDEDAPEDRGQDLKGGGDQGGEEQDAGWSGGFQGREDRKPMQQRSSPSIDGRDHEGCPDLQAARDQGGC